MTCRRAWAEIDLAAIRENARLARGRGGRPIMAVVKADAYGHGAGPVARALDGGVEFFGVAGLEEGIALREAGALSPVFLLGAALPGEREEIVRRGFAVALSTLAEARRFNAVAAALGVRHPVHLSADTGMGRMGFPERTFRENVLDVAALPHLRVDGVCSHLPSADEDFEYTEMQLARFAGLVESLTRRPRYAHICNSAGLLGYETDGTDNLTRPGLMLYGVSPIESFQRELRPALALKTRVALVRSLAKGASISYGRTFIAKQPMTVATLAIGYGDGYPRHLSNVGAEVLIGGRRCPILGRVTMDQVVVDAGGVPGIAPGDEAVLIGRQGGDEITAAEVAQLSGTIPWEVLTGIAKRVRRVYFGAGKLARG